MFNFLYFYIIKSKLSNKKAGLNNCLMNALFKKGVDKILHLCKNYAKQKTNSWRTG